MNITFANPAGLWALLGIPTILLIHFLQTKSRRVMASTLFLLESLAKESSGGRRVERLRNSLPLWFQLLAVALITWVLADPRWIRSDSTQSVVVVLDSSVAMEAFRDKFETVLPDRLRRLARTAARTEWIVMESDLSRPAIYTGGDLNALSDALKKWKPRLGGHDFTPALRLGQGLMQQHGLLLFVTWHKVELPAGVELLAIGTPTDNWGFAGLRIDGRKGTWRALVKNYGTTAGKRIWWIEIGDQKTAPETLNLEAGQALTLKGSFPSGVQACTLVLSKDAFTLDDRLPMVLPHPKQLRVAMQPGAETQDFFMRLIQSLSAVDLVKTGDSPDLELAFYDPFLMQTPRGDAVVFLKEPSQRDKYLTGPIIAEQDALVDGLNWQGLLVKDTLRISKRPEDRVLLWQDDRPLILLREGAHRQLLFSFDIEQSNASRIPAFVILLHRFIDSIRDKKIAPETANFETNQQGHVTADPMGKPVVFHGTDDFTQELNNSVTPPTFRAPAVPGFFEIIQGSTPLLKGAAHFADTREADLRGAASDEELNNIVLSSLSVKNSRTDFLMPVWILMVAALLVLNWAWPGRNSA